jgi:hypothetical protein
MASEISGTEKKTLYVFAELTIDGLSPVKNNEDAVDLFELFESVSKDGNYFIFTCSCGVAGCAGYFNGISISTKNEITTWNDVDGGKGYSFSKSQILDEIKKCYEEILKFKEVAESKGLSLTISPNDAPAELLLKIYPIK